jgi:hypothetical protein
MIELIKIRESLARRRLPLSNEQALQWAIAGAFDQDGIAYLREHRLSAADVVDFFCCGIVVEVKIKGSKIAIYRQCERYCRHEEVAGLVLATNLAMTLPPLIAGKPARIADLSRAWL